MSPVNPKVLEILNKIFLNESAGVIRYLHYSFMIMGHNRIPIQKWFRNLATEAMDHTIIIGEKITSLGGHPPIASNPVEETNVHTVDQILQESLTFEKEGLALYKQLAEAAADDMALEELARTFVRTETEHIEEVEKMIRRPA